MLPEHICSIKGILTALQMDNSISIMMERGSGIAFIAAPGAELPTWPGFHLGKVRRSERESI